MPGAQTGHTSTVGFGTSTFTAPVLSITPDPEERETLETSDLTTTDYRTWTPGDLVDAGGFTMSGFYDTSQQAPITAAAETITVTLPDSVPATGAGATIAGSGFVDNWSIGEVTTDNLIPYEAHVKWADGPTYTDES